MEEAAQLAVECPICLGRLRDPRLLNCLHSICGSCMQQYAVSKAFVGPVPCPTCGQPTAITPAPGGATGAANLSANADRVHLTTDAAQISATEAPSSAESDEAEWCDEGWEGGTTACYRHDSETILLYCATCARPICAQCARTSCEQHERKSVSIAADEARSAVAALALIVADVKANVESADDFAMSYLVDMHEHKLEFLRLLEQRKADAETLLRAAYDEAVSKVELRVSIWDAAAASFMRQADDAQSQSQQLLQELDELVGRKSDLSVLTDFPVVETRLNELLDSAQVRRASLAMERFDLSCRSGEHTALEEKLFALTVAADQEAIGATASNTSTTQQRLDRTREAAAGQLEASRSEAEPAHFLHTKAVQVRLRDELSKLTHSDEGTLASVIQNVCDLLAKAPLSNRLLHTFVSMLFREAAQRRDVMPELALLCRPVSKTLLSAVSGKRSMTRHFRAFIQVHIRDLLTSEFSRMTTFSSGKRCKPGQSVNDLVGYLEFIFTLHSTGIRFKFKPIVLYAYQDVSSSARSRSAIHDCIALCLLSTEHEDLLCCGCRLLMAYAPEYASTQPGREDPMPSYNLYQHFSRIKYLLEEFVLSSNVISLMDNAVAYGEANFEVSESKERKRKSKKKQKEKKETQ